MPADTLIHPEIERYIDAMWMEKGLSDNTLSSYRRDLRQFNDWLVRLAVELETGPEYRRTGERFKQQLLENEELQDYLYGLWEDLSDRLAADPEVGGGGVGRPEDGS